MNLHTIFPDIALRLAWPATLLLAALCLYWNALGNPFISDDLKIIQGNYAVTIPTTVHLKALWTLPYTQGLGQQDQIVSLMDEDPAGRRRTVYRPVTTTTFWINARVTGVTAAPFRVVNVTLHAAACWALGLWIGSLFGAVSGFVASALLLLHPLGTDVINKIVQRADILAVLGTAGPLAIQRAAQATGWTLPRALGVFLLAAIAFGAKESGLALLPLAGLQSLVQCLRDRTTARLSLEWPGLAAIAIAAACYFAGRILVLNWAPYRPDPEWDLLGNPLIGKSFIDRLPAIGALCLDYLRTLLLPWPLLGFDSPDSVPSWSTPLSWVGVATLSSFAATTAILALRGHYLALATGWFISVFAIIGHLITPIGAYREARFAYSLLGSLGVAVGFLATRFRSAPRVVAASAVGVVVLIAGIWSIIIVTRNHDFRSIQLLVEKDASYRPDSPATLFRLGQLHEHTGSLREAETYYRRAIDAAPWSHQATETLGTFLVAQHRDQEARVFLERAVTIAPSPTALVTLFSILVDSGDLATAERYLRQAQQIAPDNLWVQYDFARLADLRGNRSDAIQRLEAIIRQDPSFGPAREGLEQLR